MELNGLRNIVQSTGPLTPHTASSLRNVLKEQWNEQVSKKAFDLEVQGASLDMQRDIQRQMRFIGDPHIPENQMYVVSTTPNPFSHEELRRRELKRLGLKKKPSYRQRQKNGRAGRK